MERERSFFRLEYPPHDRPTLRLGGVDHPVADLSEQGVRFLGSSPGALKGNAEEQDGVVVLASGEELPVRGRIIRSGDGFVVLRLSKGVPLQLMVREQQRLRREHRRFKDGDLASGGARED